MKKNNYLKKNNRMKNKILHYQIIKNHKNKLLNYQMIIYNKNKILH